MPPKPLTTAQKRLTREIKDMNEPDALPIGCQVFPNDSNILQPWDAIITGPEGSAYEGGQFKVKIDIPANYPFVPPKLQFQTKIYHANISAQGYICIDILKSSWSPALSILKVLLSVSSLLADPNPHDPLMPEIAQKFLKDRAGHDATAKDWTRKYASPKLADLDLTKEADTLDLTTED